MEIRPERHVKSMEFVGFAILMNKQSVKPRGAKKTQRDV
jgi:hypothetical protein